LPESGELTRVRGRERAGKGSPLPKSSIPRLGRVWEMAGEGAHRRPMAVAARSSAPASSRPGIENGRRARLYGILGETPGTSADSEGAWSDSSVAAASAVACVRRPAAVAVREVG
jgi:hypothetical protein